MPRVSILGVEIDPLTLEEFSDLVAKVIALGRKGYIIANHNLRSVYLYHRDPKMRAFFSIAHTIFVDGMPLILWAKALGYPLKRSQRLTYVDWGPRLMARAAEEGWRIFYLGGKPGVAERAAERLRSTYPGLQIKTHHGYLEAIPREQVLGEINAYRPHILMVGMGMPLQEHWVLKEHLHLQVRVILTVGAAFDYVAGVIPTPPRWMGRLGLEWLYRLMAEPRRLWRRYLWEPWSLLPLLLKDLRNLPKHREMGQKLRSPSRP